MAHHVGKAGGPHGAALWTVFRVLEEELTASSVAVIVDYLAERVVVVEAALQVCWRGKGEGEEREDSGGLHCEGLCVTKVDVRFRNTMQKSIDRVLRAVEKAWLCHGGRENQNLYLSNSLVKRKKP